MVISRPVHCAPVVNVIGGDLLLECLVVVGVVFAINLVPAFGPPTWAVLVLLRVQTEVPGWALVLLGAVSAAGGRFALGTMSRALRGRFSSARLKKLAAARTLLLSGRTRGIAVLALFAVSPLPSAQLFVAAGLLDVPLLRFTLAFFAGRIVSYTFYVAVATIAERSLGDLVRQSLISPVGILLQLLMVGVVIVIGSIDWTRVAAAAERRRHRRAEPS